MNQPDTNALSLQRLAELREFGDYLEIVSIEDPAVSKTLASDPSLPLRLMLEAWAIGVGGTIIFLYWPGR